EAFLVPPVGHRVGLRRGRPGDQQLLPVGAGEAVPRRPGRLVLPPLGQPDRVALVTLVRLLRRGAVVAPVTRVVPGAVRRAVRRPATGAAARGRTRPGRLGRGAVGPGAVLVVVLGAGAGRR